jgi:8-oxo-dGTP diphosphatase
MDSVHVVVAIIRDAGGRFLIGQRGPGAHMAGAWEFPGGKKEPDETRLAALERELAEELGIAVVSAQPFIEVAHAYSDRRVRLDVWVVGDYRGEPAPREGQRLRWATVEELADTGLLEADRPIVAALRALAEPQ